jgi:hypothetical protein
MSDAAVLRQNLRNEPPDLVWDPVHAGILITRIILFLVSLATYGHMWVLGKEFCAVRIGGCMTAQFVAYRPSLGRPAKVARGILDGVQWTA